MGSKRRQRRMLSGYVSETFVDARENEKFPNATHAIPSSPETELIVSESQIYFIIIINNTLGSAFHHPFLMK